MMFGSKSIDQSPAATWLSSVVLISMLMGYLAAAPPAALPASTQVQPFWARPGCHRVTHFRTISIPGCLKFEVGTNSCRGYCMSFSIPAAEDIGPADETEIDPEMDPYDIATTPRPARRRSAAGILAGQVAALGREIYALGTGGQPRGPPTTTTPRPDDSESLFPATFVDSSENRDIVSVSQCCNMVETEDVIVNLRCGLNETRRLVFKSAKSCECFFCKHN